MLCVRSPPSIVVQSPLLSNVRPDEYAVVVCMLIAIIFEHRRPQGAPPPRARAVPCARTILGHVPTPLTTTPLPSLRRRNARPRRRTARRRCRRPGAALLAARSTALLLRLRQGGRGGRRASPACPACAAAAAAEPPQASARRAGGGREGGGKGKTMDCVAEGVVRGGDTRIWYMYQVAAAKSQSCVSHQP